MCGIHLTIATVPSSGQVPLAYSSSSSQHGATTTTTTGVVDSACVVLPSSDSRYPAWLPGRGPDGVGTVQWDEYPRDGSRNTSSSSSSHSQETIRVTLHASVLAMRDTHVAQPVPIMASNNGNMDDTDDVVAHLAWNGEVYQMLVPASDNSPCNTDTTASFSPPTQPFELDSDDSNWMLEDVFDCSVADTAVVAEMMQTALESSTAARVNGHSNGMDRMQGTAHRLAWHVLNRLVNAEYAFCLLTKDAVFYGRDALGRRSLLVSDGSALCGTVDEAKAQSLSDSWQLSSVATVDTLFAAPWTEVEPGMVHAYYWQTHIHVQVPIRVLSLPKPPLALMEPIPNNDHGAAAAELRIVLQEAVRRRCQATATTHDSSVAVLFSGGLDSTVVAALALECGVTDLTLLTVSFVDSAIRSAGDDDGATTAKATLAADAMAAEQSFGELRELYPHIKIRLVHRTVDWQQVAREEARIRQLMYPKTTVMDLNIATALWFAASASYDHNDGPIHAHRVLLSGLGADELLGGYGRHRSAYERGGYPGLRHELNVDIGRLWERNLGRDDRIVSDSSHEVRFPFLDAMVMHYVESLPLDVVVDFSLPAGEGDKRILRLVAESLQLTTAATAVKRAIQFGSRIAHVSDKRRFGSRRKAAGDKVS
jgi:asparagine synthetase B (glutamine-hydrolysing)